MLLRLGFTLSCIFLAWSLLMVFTDSIFSIESLLFVGVSFMSSATFLSLLGLHYLDAWIVRNRHRFIKV